MSSIRDGKAPKVPKKEAYDLYIDNLKNNCVDESQNFLKTDKQTRNRKVYHIGKLSSNKRAGKQRETLGGKSSLKKRELKNLK
jgi:hypothetical protein